MIHTWSSHIKRQLIDSGFTIVKNQKENRWALVDGNEELMYNSNLGDLLRKSAKEFNLK